MEECLYDYIHPDILDTISFKFEEFKNGYDQQLAVAQAEKDSFFRIHLTDSLVQALTQNNGTWIENIPQDIQKEKNALFFMPSWKFSLLLGDTIYSDSINSRFLLIDMWYVSCAPCMGAMVELSSIYNLYEKSLLKIISINVFDEDTVAINKVVRNLNLKCNIACAYHSDAIFEMSKQMGKCHGYPQLYLIDMKTKQVIWNSCGWYKGFTKDVEKIIKDNE